MKKLTGTGVWSAGLRSRDEGLLRDTAAELEALGYTSLWIPDHSGAIFEPIERLLAATRTITVGTGVLSLWMYDPNEVGRTRERLRQAYGDRIIIGIGVSHSDVVEKVLEDTRWEKPLQKMRSFLDAIDASPTPVAVDDRVLAALGPKMLELAAARAGGAIPYNGTPEHTALARATLGPSKLLIPEQAVALVADAAEGRRLARQFLEHYVNLPNYVNNLRRLGFTEDDFVDGGSDRLVDALVAWGDEATIAQRLQEHRDAGADSVCIQVVTAKGMVDLPIDVWRALAPALT